MDNSYILLLILKKGVNVGAFITWVYYYYENHLCYPPFDYYVHDDTFDVISYKGHTYQNRDRLGIHSLNEFEYNHLISYLSLTGLINV